MTPNSPPRKHIAIFVPSMRGGGAERVMLMLSCIPAAHIVTLGISPKGAVRGSQLK